MTIANQNTIPTSENAPISRGSVATDTLDTEQQTFITLLVAVDEATATSHTGSLADRIEAIRTASSVHDTFAIHSRQRLYAMVAAAYALACDVYSDDDLTNEFNQLLDSKAVKPFDTTDVHANQFLPLVRIIWGDFKTTKSAAGTEKIKWVPDRSAEKYAPVIRFLSEQDIPVEEAASYIEDYDEKKHGKKLAGIVAADRAKHGASRTSSKPDVQTLRDPAAYAPIGSIDRPNKLNSLADKSLVVLIGRIEGDQLSIVGSLDEKGWGKQESVFAQYLKQVTPPPASKEQRDDVLLAIELAKSRPDLSVDELSRLVSEMAA